MTPKGVVPVTQLASAMFAVMLIGFSSASYSQTQSRVIAGDGRSAMDCVSLKSLGGGTSRVSGGNQVLVNGCTDEVEVGWCYVDGDCRTETGSSTTLQPGRSWPVDGSKEIRWAACHGKNSASFEKGTLGLRYVCKSATAPKPATDEASDEQALHRDAPADATDLLGEAVSQAELAGAELEAARANDLKLARLAQLQQAEADAAAKRPPAKPAPVAAVAAVAAAPRPPVPRSADYGTAEFDDLVAHCSAQLDENNERLMAQGLGGSRDQVAANAMGFTAMGYTSMYMNTKREVIIQLINEYDKPANDIDPAAPLHRCALRRRLQQLGG